MATNLIIETVEQPSHAPVASPPPEQSAWKQHWKLFLVLALACMVCVISAFLFFTCRFSTDDAQVDSHISSISPRISGYVDKILVDDNQHVEAGQLLARIDPRDCQAQLDQAAASREVATA
jgi:membrane fusion protein (multidrug efflux system)